MLSPNVVRVINKTFLSATAATCIFFVISSTSLQALNLFRNGTTALSQGLGGVDAVGQRSFLDAIASNPAMLNDHNGLRVATHASYGEYQPVYTNPVNNNAGNDYSAGIVPGVGLMWHPEDSKFAFGFGFVPDITLNTRFQLNDRPGGLSGTTSYGNTVYSSVFNISRTAALVSYEVNEKLSLGASFGLLYNYNELTLPYVFQNTPGLVGAKVLLDTNTDGYGFGAQFGLVWQPNDKWTLGVSLRPTAHVESSGTSTGTASAEFQALGLPFSALPPEYSYRADIRNTVPMTLKLGVEFEPTEKTSLYAQFEFIEMSGEYDTLTVNLSNGTNPNLPSTIVENPPMNWDDQYILRLGIEQMLNDNIGLLAGTAFANNVFPDGTVTPVNGINTEAIISGGVFYESEKWLIGASGQYLFENESSAGTNDFVGIDYEDYSYQLDGFWLNLTLEYRF